MTDERGDAAGAGLAAGDVAAADRLARLFEQFDRLTPDELARIGLGTWDDEEHEALLDAVDVAAVRTGRVAMVHDARRRAAEAALQRYSGGSLHPTWVGLNWGISQGRVEDRVGIVEALSDAAAAAVVADALDPDALEALSLPAEHVVGLAGGMVSEGSLGRQLAVPADPDLGRQTVRRMVAVGAGLMVLITILPLAFAFDLPAASIIALLAAVLVVAVALRR